MRPPPKPCCVWCNPSPAPKPIFTALAELSTRQIAETAEATGMTENAEAATKGGAIAKQARKALEAKTGKPVVSGENFLPPGKPDARKVTKKS